MRSTGKDNRNTSWSCAPKRNGLWLFICEQVNHNNEQAATEDNRYCVKVSQRAVLAKADDVNHL